MKPRLVTAVKLALGLTLIAILLHWLETDELLATARNVDGRYFIAAMAFSFAMVAVSCWKWWFILRLQNHPVPFRCLYRAYFTGYFYSQFLPSNVGGDMARAWLAAKQCGSGSAAVISVFVERISGLVVLLGLTLIAPLVLGGYAPHPTLWAATAAAPILMAGLVGLLVLNPASLLRSTFLRAAARRIKSAIRADRPGTTARLWESAEQRIIALSTKGQQLKQVFRKQPGALVSLAALAVLFYAMTWINVGLAYRTFGQWPEWEGIAAVLPAALLVAMIPLSLGNLGIAEGSYVFFFGLAGMSGELTLAMSLLLRLKVFVLGLIGFAFQWGRHPEAARPANEMTDNNEPEP